MIGSYELSLFVGITRGERREFYRIMQVFSSNNQKNVDYLVSQDKEFQRRMDFTKSQGRFFEKVLRPIEDQIQRCRFIVDNFYRTAVELSNLYKKDAPPKEASQEVCEWPKLSSLRSLKQPLTPDQMRYVCNAIQSNTISDINAIPKHKYTVIDFKEGSQTWDDQVFTLNNMTLGIKVLGGGVFESFDLSKDRRLDAAVYIRSEERRAEAFLRAKGIDGKEYYFELEEFSMLYRLCDNDDIEEKNDDAHDVQKSAGYIGHIA